uniref:Sn1-specific diacylglycerol lipase alpha n=1 Tax=Aegilops tauschii TaxID=37682 RepID=M8CYD4_AEGTA
MGLALLQKHGNLPDLQTDLVEAPHKLMREAAVLHPFAEACYTVGHYLTWTYFLCMLALYDMERCLNAVGIWNWNITGRPALDGDNWWRGHAAAFLRFVNIAPTALVRGRVRQSKREAAYFVVVLHDKKTVLIGVRGTETPEDLITDGLCRECAFTMEDLDGLVNSEVLPVTTREKVISTFPHYGHGGIVEAARELFMQLNDCTGDNGNSENTSSKKLGFLSTLVQEGRGAVATVLGMMLFGRYPDVHVYAYGPLPCVDLIIAEACSQFVTTIVNNDEFSSRLSINSILRLRSAAISTLSDNSPDDTAMIQKLARRILNANKHHERRSPHQDALCNTEPDLQDLQNGLGAYNGPSSSIDEPRSYRSLQIDQDVRRIPLDGHDSGLEEAQTSSGEILVESREMFLAGLIIHVVRNRRSLFPLWKCWNPQEAEQPYKAVFAKRENFRDIAVTPSMFMDHLPWR